MKILFISPFFPPLANSEAFCGGKLVLTFLAAGWQPHVLYNSNIRPGAASDLSPLWSDLKDVQTSVEIPYRRSLVERVALGLRYGTTSWAIWLKGMIGAANKLHRKHRFDVLITRSLPWQTHLAGFWIARSIRIPWIANHNDALIRPEWQTEPDLRRWLGRLFQTPSALAFPSDRLRDYMLKDSPEQNSKLTSIIPHIGGAEINPDDAKDTDSKFVLLHAGKLGHHENPPRSGQALLVGMADLLKRRPQLRERLRLTFVGPEDGHTSELAASLNLLHLITWTGIVSYQESLRYIKQASVCVLIEADTAEGFCLPSKLCDYIAFGKPVLAFSPRIGVANDLAQEGGITRVDCNDAHAASSAIESLFDAYDQNRLKEFDPPLAIRSRFTAEAVTQTYSQLFERVLAVTRWGQLERAGGRATSGLIGTDQSVFENPAACQFPSGSEPPGSGERRRFEADRRQC